MISEEFRGRKGCGPVNDFPGTNALKLSKLRNNLVMCQANNQQVVVVPMGWVYTQRLSGLETCGRNNQAGYNALRLHEIYDGIIVCSGGAADEPYPPWMGGDPAFCEPQRLWTKCWKYNAMQLN